MTDQISNLRFANDMGEKYEFHRRLHPNAGELRSAVASSLKNLNVDDAQEKPRVLEIGCGSGLSTEYLVSTHSTAEFELVDSDSTMLENLRSHTNLKSDFGRLRIINEDIVRFLKRTPDNYFSAALSVYAIHNIPVIEREELYKDLYRVLKPGGFFCNGDRYMPNDQKIIQSLLEEEIELWFRELLPRNEEALLRKWIVHSFADQSRMFFCQEAAEIELIRNSGLVNVTAKNREGFDLIVTAFKPLQSR